MRDPQTLDGLNARFGVRGLVGFEGGRAVSPASG